MDGRRNRERRGKNRRKNVISLFLKTCGRCRWGWLPFIVKCALQKEVFLNWICPVLCPNFQMKYNCFLLSSQYILSPLASLDSAHNATWAPRHLPFLFPSDRIPRSCLHFLTDKLFYWLTSHSNLIFIGSWPFPGNTQQRRIRGQLVFRLLVNSCLMVSSNILPHNYSVTLSWMQFSTMNSNDLLFQLTNYSR